MLIVLAICIIQSFVYLVIQARRKFWGDWDQVERPWLCYMRLSCPCSLGARN